MANVILFRVTSETWNWLATAASAPDLFSAARPEDEDALLAEVSAAVERGAPIDAIVLGPDVDTPGRLAEMLRARDADVAILVLASLAARGEAPGAAHEEAADVVAQLRRALHAESGRRARAEVSLEDLREETRTGTAERDEMLAMIAHDIRAPLAVIGGATAELAHPGVGTLSDDQRALVALVKNGVERLNRLASNLVAIAPAPPAARRARVSTRTTHDLTAIVRASVQRAQADEAAHGVRVRCEVPGDPVEAVVDGEKVALLVSNLIANAVQLARSQVCVRIVATPKVVRIEVEDDGDVPADDLPADAFGHAHAGLPRASRTSRGMGPALIRSIVAAHGGTLRAEKLSIDGLTRGARLVVTLPTHDAGDRAIVH